MIVLFDGINRLIFVVEIECLLWGTTWIFECFKVASGCKSLIVMNYRQKILSRATGFMTLNFIKVLGIRMLNCIRGKIITYVC